MKANYEETVSSSCAIVYTSGIAMLDEKQIGSNYRVGASGEIQITERIKHDTNNYSCIRAFVQEVNSNSTPPSHMKLIADFSDKSPYTKILRSLKILNSPKGYSFRAYESEFWILGREKALASAEESIANKAVSQVSAIKNGYCKGYQDPR